MGYTCEFNPAILARLSELDIKVHDITSPGGIAINRTSMVNVFPLAHEFDSYDATLRWIAQVLPEGVRPMWAYKNDEWQMLEVLDTRKPVGV